MEKSQPTNLTELWATPCSQLVKSQQVIVIDSEASVAEGCKILVKNKISSAPVWNKSTNSFVGMFDYRDVVDFVLLVFHKKELAPISEDETIGISEIVEMATSGKPVPLRFASDLSHKNPFYSVLGNASLLTAAQVLASKQGIHRINVVEENGIVAVLSQTDIVRYIAQNLKCIQEFSHKTIEELNLICRSPVTISADSPVMEAMKRMSEYSVSSIAVVSHQGQLIGNISMADIKYIFSQSRYARLWTTCSHFNTLILNQQGIENDGKDKFPVFEVTLASTFEHVLRKIIATKVHRVWVVDEAKHVIGVISLTDIIKLCLDHSSLEQ